MNSAAKKLIINPIMGGIKTSGLGLDSMGDLSALLDDPITAGSLGGRLNLIWI